MNQTMTPLAALGACLVLSLAANAALSVEPGDPAAGEATFLLCSACHTAEPGGLALIGPNLNGVVGSDIASREGFEYSDSLASLEGTWDEATLDRFLSNPMAFAPGTRMGIAGIANARERANLIAYLASLAGAPAGATAAPAPDFGSDWPAGPGQLETGRLCDSCHSLAIVKQQGLSRESWDDLLDWMVEEQGMAEQTPDQRALILEYLATHFGVPE